MNARKLGLIAALVIGQLSLVTVAGSSPVGAVDDGAISGTVTSGPSIVTDASVTIVDADTLAEVASVGVDANGEYTLSALPYGDYRAFARVEANQNRLWYQGDFDDPIPTDAGIITLDVTTPTSLGVSFDFPTGSFAGTINGASDGFNPATATFTDVDTGYTETTPIDPSNTFGIGYLPTGTYQLRVDYQASRSHTFPQTFATDVDSSISIAVPNTVDGTVTGPSGPVSGANVTLEPTNSGPWSGLGSTVTTGLDGSFAFAGLPDEAYQISVTPPGQYTPRYYGGADFSSSTTLDLGPANPAVTITDFSLAGGGFTGGISDGTNALAGAVIQFGQTSDPMGEPMNPLHESTTADENGTYTIGYLPAGTYSVSYLDEVSYEWFTIASELATDGTSLTTADLTVPTGTITGTVRSGEGTFDGTIDYAQVQLQTLDGTTVRSAQVDSGGVYSISGVADGDYYVTLQMMNGTTVFHPSGADRDLATVVTLDAIDRALAGVDIALPTNRITGTVTAGESAVGGASITVYDADTYMSVGWASTETDGSFTVESLPDGNFRLAVSTPSGSEVFYGGSDFYSATVVTLDETTPVQDVAITLPNGVVAGRLLDGGEPITSTEYVYQLQLESVADGTSNSTWLQIDGSFRFTNVANGSYRLRYVDGVGEGSYYPNGASRTNATILTLDNTTQLIEGIDLEVPNGEISGTVRRGLDPLVTGDYSEVALYEVAPGEFGEPEWVRSTPLSPEGTYSFASVGDGDYLVGFTQNSPYGRYFHPGVTNFADATTVALGEGGRTRTDIDIQLPDGTISGIVTSGPDMTPVVGAEIRVSPVAFGPFVSEATAITETDGRFTVTGLADGDYRLSVRPPGSDSETWYGGTNSDNATLITLNAADNDAEGIEVPLASGRISGEVIGDVDGDGWMAHLVTTSALPTITTTIQSDGTFQFDYVPDGQYRVGFRSGMNLQGFAPGVEALADARIIEISPSVPTVDDVTITLPQGRINGTVTIGGDALPPDTFTSISVERIGPFPDANPPDPLAPATAESNGTYTVGSLYPGRYVVRASGSTGSPFDQATSTSFNAYHRGSSSRLDATIVEITGAAPTVDDVDIDAQTRSISGVVREGGVTVDGTNRNIVITLYDPAEPSNNPQVTVSQQGTFSFTNLGDGDYYIYYLDADTQIGGSYPNGEADLRSATPVTVDATTPVVDSIVLDLPGLGSIQGTITNAAPGASVTLSRASAGQGVGWPVATTTPTDGTFRFDDVPAGDYRVTTTILGDPGENATVIYAPGTLLANEEQTVTVTPGATATTSIEVPAPVTISGRVTDPNGLGVDGVAVYRFDTEGFYTPTRKLIATTNANGDYTSQEFLPKPTAIEFDPPDATGYTSAFHGGSPVYTGAELLVLTSGEQRTGIDGVVGQRGSISGTVTGPDGLPAAGYVSARAAGAQVSYTFGAETFDVLTTDGNFAFESLPPGEWILDVTSVGPEGEAMNGPYARTFSGDTMYRDAAVSFVLPSGGSVTENVQLQAGQTIRGRVTRPDGRPLASAQASIQPIFPIDDPWSVSKSDFTDADGRYEIRGITPGEVQLAHSTSGFYPEYAAVYHPGVTDPNDATPFTVPATGTIPDIDVQLGAGGNVSGTATIVDSNGDPVDVGLLNWYNAFVCRAPAVPSSSYGCSDNSYGGFQQGRLADGTITFAGMPAGRYNAGAVGSSYPSPATATFDVVAGQTFHCTLPMRTGGVGATCTVTAAPPTGSISGTVIGPDGLPLAGAQVTAHLGEFTAIAGATTDALGAYRLDAPTGEYRLKVTEPYVGAGGGQSSLPEWYRSTGSLYAVGPPPSYATGYDEAPTIHVVAGTDLVDYDFDLDRYAIATATVIGGAPAGPGDSVLLCPAPTVPSSTSASPCAHPTTGASFSYPNVIPRVGDGYETDYIAPATYNVALVRYGYFPNYTFEVLTDTVQVTVRGSERFDCELALTGSGQSSTCLVSPYFDDDADGVSLNEENGAPNNGNGNGDDTPDSEQANVASLVDPTVVDPVTEQPPTDGSNYITLASTTIVETTGEPAPLTSVTLAPVPSTPPPDEGAEPQTGLISFAADFRDPETGFPPATPVTASFEVYLPSPATQYWKYDEEADAAGQNPWTDATELATFDANPIQIGDVDRWRVVLRITDGGFGDADGTVNGIIDDPAMFTFGGLIEVTPPTITCPPQQTFIVGQPDATLTAAVTGIDDPTIVATVSTEAAGPQFETISASNPGGTTTEDCGYTVTYRFQGFQQPIDTDAVNKVKAGRTVPVKWRLTEWDGTPVSDRASFVRLTSSADACITGAPTDDIETTTTGSGLTYTGDGNWLYNWKTTGLAAGCRELRLQIYGAPEIVTAAFDLR